VVVLTGPPGAGKKTIARELGRRQPKAVHLHTDDFWGYIVTGLIPPYEPCFGRAKSDGYGRAKFQSSS